MATGRGGPGPDLFKKVQPASREGRPGGRPRSARSQAGSRGFPPPNPRRRRLATAATAAAGPAGDLRTRRSGAKRRTNGDEDRRRRPRSPSSGAPPNERIPRPGSWATARSASPRRAEGGTGARTCLATERADILSLTHLAASSSGGQLSHQVLVNLLRGSCSGREIRLGVFKGLHCRRAERRGPGGFAGKRERHMHPSQTPCPALPTPLPRAAPEYQRPMPGEFPNLLLECFRRVNSGGDCGTPRGRGGGRHGVRGASGGVPARGPGFPQDPCPRTPYSPPVFTPRKHSI